MKREFENKVAVVTGGAGGIGSEIIKNLLKRGTKVIAVDLNENLLNLLKEKFSDNNLAVYSLDITDLEAVKGFYENVKGNLGEIDFLFNNAGAVHRSKFSETKIAVFKRVMDVNVWGAVYLTKLFLNDIIARKGAIEVTSSVAGFAPLYGRTFYSGSKFALHGIFETLRTELKDTGVSVTIVSPGFTKTSFEQAAMDAKGKNLSRKRKNVGKYLTPEYVGREIVKAVENNRRFVVLSLIGKVSLVLRKYLPVFYDYLMYRSVKEEFDRD